MPMTPRWLWLPGIGFLALFFVLPVGSFLLQSVFDPQPTLQHLERLFASRASWRALGNTFRIAALVTASCALLGFVVALRLATLRRSYANALLLIVIVTVWISLLVRNYAWMVLLGREGLVSAAFVGLGIFERKTSLLFNEAAVVVAMTHVLLPFMVLPIYAALHSVEPALVRAAESLGARPWQTLVRILLPLALPGLATGCLLVFTLALGFYVTPAVLGGPGQTTLTMLMEVEVNEQLNWGYAAAHAAILIAVTAILFAVYRMKFGLDRLWGQAA